jgi:hypothetical protein
MLLSPLRLLIGIYVRLAIGRLCVTAIEKGCVGVPLSMDLGWISAATIANFTDWLEDWPWDGWGIAPQMGGGD